MWELIQSLITRTYKNNAMMSLFQKLECGIFFKKAKNFQIRRNL
ncbi:hypothetical protein G436_0744 [Leptospira interrogans serovar Hardjo str. Norma]|uniref:Uncharacterized protein n=1 Tax=Leptospira interrogans serovar Hardjo str. Norma TaxID=1279460 RepID=A0A0M4NTJ3_LEPIR|nr:hypothetical protein G436_0744 [Leptospira interrogans serovar Hardjo str. Norma]EKO97474.1 hypothetical protein LEP1GSC057_3005 [Leptospira interrogans str. Brem 329]EMN66269.1 hypothetical protein LEP1GSC098_3383 [Leptospira interrogans serovar Grippotyphosa str. UI 08434]